MAKKKKKHASSASLWRGRRAAPAKGDWLRGLACALAMALAVAIALFVLPESGAGAENLPAVIRRVMTSNPSACYSVEGRYYDWLEIANTTDAPLDLSGWKLSDSADLRGAYIFDGVTIPARGSLIVYCDDAPEDYEGGEIFTGFRLSADGELLVLADQGQRRIQTLSVPAMNKTDVYQRSDDTGEYAVLSFAEAMGEDAANLGSLTPAYTPGGVEISEVMASNRTTLTDEDGDYSDWIELHNASAAPVSLQGYTLSDDDANRRKWALPPVTLQSGEYRLVFASDKDRASADGELHANFKLSAKGEAVRLYTPMGEVASWLEYDALGSDVSVSRREDGALTTELLPTPGYANTAEGARSALTRLTQNDLGLYINEVFAAGEGDDWVEIHNAGPGTVDLSGMGLSDSLKKPRRWQFPEGASIPSGGYVVVLLPGRAENAEENSADGMPVIQDEALTESAAPSAASQAVPGVNLFTADFAISQGEAVVLSRPDGEILDRVLLFDRNRDLSYGRAEGQERYRCFAETTPGRANSATSYAKQAGDVVFSVPGGQHAESALELTLASDDDVNIYYTTDGSTPSPSSKVYDGPIAITANTVVKAVAWREDALQSPLAVQSYILGVSHTLRLVSVTGKRSQLNGSSGTLNTGAKKDGYDVYVEIYDTDGTQMVGQACQLKLAGHSSRINYAQKSFSLRAKKQYGDGWFRAELFEQRGYGKYKSIVMRASGQDNQQTMMRDSILTALASETTLMYQETVPSVVYVNGEYWGVYNMRERVSAHSIAQHEGWDDPDDIIMIEGNGNATQGSSASYWQMLRWVKQHDMSKDENVEALREYVDIENYLDYVAMQIYICNQDLNNVRCYCNPAVGGKWRWVLFDVDLSYQIDRNNVSDWLYNNPVGTITQQDNTLFIALMKNAALKDYFLTRVGQQLATTLSAENVLSRIKERYEILSPEMEKHCKRWKWSTKTWDRYVKNMVTYATNRPAKLAGYYKKAFHLSDAQAQQYFGDVAGFAG